MRRKTSHTTCGPGCRDSHHPVDHITWDIGGQAPDGGQVLQLPFPQCIPIHARRGSQPNGRATWTHPNNKIKLRYVT